LAFRYCESRSNTRMVVNGCTMRLRQTLLKLLARLGPAVTLLVLFLTALGVLVVTYGASFKWVEGPIVIAGTIALGLVAIHWFASVPALVRRQRGAAAMLASDTRDVLRDWAPFVVLMWAFESLETYTGLFGRSTIVRSLYEIDLQWFGVEPTVWIGRFHHPVLTDWMAFAYGSYFVTPMIVAVMLSLRHRRADFSEMSTALVIQMGIGFALFLLFPAGPPRYYPPFLHGAFQPPQLFSHFGLYEFQQGAFDTADPVRTRSAFPSLHCSFGVLTLLSAWRFGDAVVPRMPRLFFWICVPVVVSLWCSTIYLRHHWIPDCLAGFVLGVSSDRIAIFLRTHWPSVATTQRT